MNDKTTIAKGSLNIDVKALYFIGIGGIGMSALARYFNSKGVKVSGYDRTPTTLTHQLEDEGISIHYTEDVSLLPKDVDMVVYTPAVPQDRAELQYYRSNNYKVVKRSDVLGMLTESSFNICVAGTHGKTTVSTIIAHILRNTGYGCNAFLGGIAANYGSNFWSSDNNVCVIEADEYDRSFLKLSPDIAVITATDPDHLDIYGTAADFEKAFITFSERVKPAGCLIVKKGLKRECEFTAIPANQEKRTGLTYSLNDSSADVHAGEVKVENGSYRFDVIAKDWKLHNVKLHMGGLHNVENVVAAVAVAKQLGIDDGKIKAAIENFQGVKRRFEYLLKSDDRVLIDDYAHHPEELKALIHGVRSLFKHKLVLVFQPHLYSRTKDQADGFAEVLDLADEVVLLPIYPARELPMQGVSSEIITERMKMNNKKVLSKEALMHYLEETQPNLLVMAGAGDIDVLVPQVKEILEKQ